MKLAKEINNPADECKKKNLSSFRREKMKTKRGSETGKVANI